MKRCDSELLFHHVLGESEGPQRREVEEHLRNCSRCRDERDEFQALIESAKNLNEVPHPATARVEARIAAAQRKRSRPILPISVAAGALAAGALFSTILPSPSVPGGAELSLAELRSLQGDNGSWSDRVGPTAFATLALIEEGSGPRTGADRGRIDEAFQFLTREKDAAPLDELLRCLALLRQNEREGRRLNPQLQAAFDHAVRVADASPSPESLGLLREIVARGKQLGLRAENGEKALGRLLARSEPSAPASADWSSITKSLARSQPKAAEASIRLASLFLRARD